MVFFFLRKNLELSCKAIENQRIILQKKIGKYPLLLFSVTKISISAFWLKISQSKGRNSSPHIA